MMLKNSINRILQVLYPALIFGFVLLVWGSSNLAYVAALTPPPVNGGLNIYWNPCLIKQSSCEQKLFPKNISKEANASFREQNRKLDY